MAIALRDGDELLDPDQVAALLRVRRRYVVKEFSKKCPPVRIGRFVRWWKSDVLRTVEEWQIELSDRQKKNAKRPPKDFDPHPVVKRKASAKTKKPQ